MVLLTGGETWRTRMRLRAEFVEDAEIQRKMLSDLAEMEAMINATLAFARDDAAHEPREAFDFVARHLRPQDAVCVGIFAKEHAMADNARLLEDALRRAGWSRRTAAGCASSRPSSRTRRG